MLSISAHKFHGPKGVGALVCRTREGAEPIVYGGGQSAAVVRARKACQAS